MEFFGNIIKGIMIGIANIIPGVSGGTMAVSLGIYDRLIGSISGLFREFKKSILFLIPIIIGAGIGIVGFTYAIEYLLDKHTFVTCMAFVGLILGGLPAIFSSMRAKVSSGGVGVFGILAFVIAFAISGGMPLLKESKDALTVIAVTPGNMGILFILGIVASATMVIPGVSGSMMLMIFGYYYAIINTIKTFLDKLSTLEGFIHCPECGAKIEKTSAFCSKCGAKIAETKPEDDDIDVVDTAEASETVGEEKTDETCTCETVPDEKFETESAETTVNITEDQE